MSRLTLSAASHLAIASGATLVLAGCGQPDSVPQTRFSQDYAQALCTALQPCCAQNGVSFDYAACTKGWKAAVDDLLATTSNYDSATATKCVQMVQAAAGASCQPGPGTLSAARDTCQQVFAGQTPAGSPCTSASQCAQVAGSIVTCAVGPSDAGGGGGQLPLGETSPRLMPLDSPVSLEDIAVCVVEPLPEAGAAPACSIQADAGTDSCRLAGTYCDPMTKTCLPIGAAGAMCDPAVVTSCQPGNYCVRGGMANATCAPGNPAGSPCTNSVQCDATSICDTAATHMCVLREKPGQSCTSGNQCSIGVCDPTTHKCLVNAIATTAACNGVTGQ